MQNRLDILVVDWVKQKCNEYAKNHFVDVIYFGKASNIYKWEFTLNMELDICFFIDSFNLSTGQIFQQLVKEIEVELKKKNVDFAFRVIDGPYRKTPEKIQGYSLAIHAAIFTKDSYQSDVSKLVKWSWKKYKGELGLIDLMNFVDEMPTVTDLIWASRGIQEKINNIVKDEIFLRENRIPDFHWVDLCVKYSDTLFTEYCLSAGADTARNHGRVLGIKESDFLSNDEYYDFYLKNIFASQNFMKLIELRGVARTMGYRNIGSDARDLSLSYLNELKHHLLK